MNGEPGTSAWLVSGLGLLAAVLLLAFRIFGPDLSAWFGGRQAGAPPREDAPRITPPPARRESPLARIGKLAVAVPMAALLLWAATLAGRDAADPNRRIRATAETTDATITAVREWQPDGARIAAFDLELRVDRPGQHPEAITGAGRLVIPAGLLRANPGLRPEVGGIQPVLVEPGSPHPLRIVEPQWPVDETPVLPFAILIAVAGLAFIALLRVFGATGPPPSAPGNT